MTRPAERAISDRSLRQQRFGPAAARVLGEFQPCGGWGASSTRAENGIQLATVATSLTL
jgi:hypothetical protein